MIQAISAIKDFEGQRLAGVDRVRQRITEIESKFGINGIGANFQDVLNEEIRKAQRSSRVNASNRVNSANNVEGAASLTAASNVDSNQRAASPETASNARNVPQAAAPSNSQPAQSAAQNNNPSRTFPGEEALPESLRSSINPSAAISSNPEPRTNNSTPVEPENVETPTYETRRLSAGNGGGNTEELLLSAANKYNVDPRLAKAVAIAESNMNQNDVSDAGAIGVMQLMPETARSLGVDPYNEEQNIDGGVRFLGQMLNTFNGDVRKAVAAYNAGPGAVKKYGGIPPYRETQAYVGRVMDLYR